MTFIILIISFFITYYIYKKTSTKEKYLNEKLLLLMLLIASVVWFIVSIVDFYNYGNMVFSPSIEIFIKDIMTGFMVLAISMFLWFVSIITSGKKINKISINKDKIKQVFTKEEEKQERPTHSAPSISVDYSSNQNDVNTRKGYFPYRHDPYNK